MILFEARTVGGLGQVMREKVDTHEAMALFYQARELFDAISRHLGRDKVSILIFFHGFDSVSVHLRGDMRG